MSNIARCKGANVYVPNLEIYGKFVDEKRITFSSLYHHFVLQLHHLYHLQKSRNTLKHSVLMYYLFAQLAPPFHHFSLQLHHFVITLHHFCIIFCRVVLLRRNVR